MEKKQLIFITLVLMAISGLVSGAMAEPTPIDGSPSLSLNEPNGGETWRQGMVHTITWNYTANPGPLVRIHLMKGGVVSRTIIKSTPIGTGGDGSYRWKVPFNQTLGTDYRIRIVSANNTTYRDKSDGAFTISPPFTVTPNHASIGLNTVNGRIDGEAFMEGSTLHLQKAGTRIEIAQVKRISPTRLRFVMNLTGIPRGSYDILVTNPDGRVITLKKGFTITPIRYIDEFEWPKQSGHIWGARSCQGNPGENSWENSADTIWIDRQDRLHLKIIERNNTWYCAEVDLPTARYGRHYFYVANAIDTLDTQVVAAPFIYVNDTYEELDIEFSTWDGDAAPNNAQYVVQPEPYLEGVNLHRFIIDTDGQPSTHLIEWQQDQVHFASAVGITKSFSSENTIATFSYHGAHIPQESQTPWVILNTWLFHNTQFSPADPGNKGLELVMAGYEYDAG